MVKLLRIIVSSCIATIALTAEIQISCEGSAETVFVEGVDYTGCSCYGPGNNETTFDWTILQDSGHREPLAICYSIGNCTSYYPPSVLEVSLEPNLCGIFIHSFSSKFSGYLTCTQTNSTFNGSVTYRTKVKKIAITNCDPAMLFWEDEGSAYIYSDHSPYTPSTVTWSIYTHSRKLISPGACSIFSNNYNCTSLFAPNITLTAYQQESSITFQDGFLVRDYATAISSFTFNSSIESDNCTMILYSVANVENCNVHISRHNWSFVMYFDVSYAFNSGGQYTFQASEFFHLLKRGQLFKVYGTTSVGYRSYWKYLKSYINSTNNKLYYRGRVVYSWPLSPYPGKFTGFKVYTTHGGTNAVTYKEGLNFSLPVRPTHNCSDVTTPCSCSTETLGSPAGRLLWQIGNITVAIGDYGINQLLLPVDSLPSGQYLTVASCQLDWIQILIAKEPAVLLRTNAKTQYKSLAIAGWTLLCVVIVINGVFAVISMRQGHTIGCRCKNKAEEEEEIVTRSTA